MRKPRFPNPFPAVRSAFAAWATYGVKDRAERNNRFAIAFGSVSCLAACIFFIARPDLLSWTDAVATWIGDQFETDKFAYMMTILTSLLATACTAIITGMLARSEGDPARLERLDFLTALVIALLASIAATFGFGATYALPVHGGTAARFMLAMSFIQLSISLGVVGITLIPLVNNRHDIFVGPLVKAVSAVWWLPAGWICVLLLSIPHSGWCTIPMFFFLLAATMGQVFFPHGSRRREDPDAYERLLRTYAAWGCSVLTVDIVIAGLCVVLAMVWKDPPTWAVCLSLNAVIGLLGVAFWFYSVHIEGTRKLHPV